jgi:hypothetical protein
MLRIDGVINKYYSAVRLNKASFVEDYVMLKAAKDAGGNCDTCMERHSSAPRELLRVFAKLREHRDQDF